MINILTQGMRRIRVTRITRILEDTGISRFWRRIRVLEDTGPGRIGVRGGYGLEEDTGPGSYHPGRLRVRGALGRELGGPKPLPEP